MIFLHAIGLGACAAAPPDPGADLVCPPPPPTGFAEGERAEDVVVTDCAGNAASLHGLCGQPALVVGWYGWCPSCDANAELARSLAAELQVAVVLVEDPLTAPPDAEFCALYEDSYPSAARVWMDPEQRFGIYGGTDLVLVLGAEGTIGFVDETSSEAVIREEVEAVL